MTSLATRDVRLLTKAFYCLDGVIRKDPRTPSPKTLEPEPNPLLIELLQALAHGYYKLTCSGKSVVPKVYAHPRSSWKRVLLTQPPIASIHIRSFWKDLNSTRLHGQIDQIVNDGRVTVDDWVKCLGRIQRGLGKRYELSRSFVVCEMWDLALINETVPLSMRPGSPWTFAGMKMSEG